MKWRFSLCALALGACQPDPIPSQCPPPVHQGVTAAHGTSHDFVINHFALPAERTDFAIDLDGDCMPDNQFGVMVGGLVNAEGELQPAVDASVANGQELFLLSVTSADATLTNSSAAGVVFARARKMTNPDFSGNGHFTIDATQPQATLFGDIQDGRFKSNDPVSTRPPVDLTLELLPFAGVTTPVPLPLHGAHIEFLHTTETLTSGEIQGSIKISDVTATWYSPLAQWLTYLITTDPTNHTQLETALDIGDGNGGNCTNPDGTFGVPNDNILSICELSGNDLIANLLVGDVDTFDASGNYAPHHPLQPGTGDSLSVAIGFTAVPATF